VRFGDVGVPEQTYAEQYIQTPVNTQVPTINAENIFTIGSFVMPFAGRAVVNFWGRFAWTGVNVPCWISLSMSAQSTPPPTDTVDHTMVDASAAGGSRNDHPSHAYWTGLAKGQTVTMRTRVFIAHSLPTYEWSMAIVRMFRA
jgi:hypothetical protein